MNALYTNDQFQALCRNGAASAQAIVKDGNPPDHFPVIKLFCPYSGATWLLTEFHPESGRFFGLCDLGMGSPELGYVSHDEIMELVRRKPPLIERDLYFKPIAPLSLYTNAATAAGRIVSVDK